jgi:hypothetical protein
VTQQRHLKAVTRNGAADEGVSLDDDYPDTFLDCRDLRHAWKRLGSYHAYGEIVRVLICARCDCTARDYWSPSGIRLRSRSYDYPDGYRLSDGSTVQDIRAQVLRKAAVYDTEAAMHAALKLPHAQAGAS